MTDSAGWQGPLDGPKVIEVAGVGRGPFCGMLLADMGADVLRVDRLSGASVGADISFDPRKTSSRGTPIDPARPEAT